MCWRPRAGYPSYTSATWRPKGLSDLEEKGGYPARLDGLEVGGEDLFGPQPEVIRAIVVEDSPYLEGVVAYSRSPR